MKNEASKIYLGAVIKDPSVIAKYPAKIQWLESVWQPLYELILSNLINGKGVTINDLFLNGGEEPWWPGCEVVSDLPCSIVSITEAEKAVDVLRKAYEKDQIIALIDEIQSDLLENGENCMDKLENFVLKAKTEDKNNLIKLSDAVKLKVDNSEQILTNIQPLDELWHLNKGGLHILAARPSMGKSSLAVWILTKIARHKPVILFTLEMTTLEIVNKIQSMELSTDMPFWIDDTPAITIEEVMVKSQLACKQHKIEFIVVDYIQLLRTKNKFNNREQQISHISQSLKALAKKTNTPVLALAQLNREVEHTANKRPKLANLRESGSIEQDANSVAFLYRPDYYYAMEGKPCPMDQKDLCELILAKQRGAKIGEIKTRWIKESNDWYNWGNKQNAFL